MLVITGIKAQTTQEEYNYITKGYKVQIESGLDMKKGYTLTDLDTSKLTIGEITRSCTFKGLFRNGEVKPCAVMILYKRLDNDKTYYICIPSNNTSNEIWKQTYAWVDTIITDELSKTLILSLMKFSALGFMK